jgi:hypothetical protein
MQVCGVQTRCFLPPQTDKNEIQSTSTYFIWSHNGIENSFSSVKEGFKVNNELKNLTSPS